VEPAVSNVVLFAKPVLPLIYALHAKLTSSIIMVNVLVNVPQTLLPLETHVLNVIQTVLVAQEQLILVLVVNPEHSDLRIDAIALALNLIIQTQQQVPANSVMLIASPVSAQVNVQYAQLMPLQFQDFVLQAAVLTV